MNAAKTEKHSRRLKKFKPNLKRRWTWINWALAFAVVGGFVMLFMTRAAPGDPDGIWYNISPANISSNPNNPHDNYGFNSIVVHPTTPSTLYMGTNYQGLWRSTNSGVSWSKINTGTGGNMLDQGRNWALAIDPHNPNIIWTTSGYGAGGPLKSTDGGVSWTKLPVGSPTQADDVYSIAIDPYTPNHILLAWHSNWSTGDSGISESFNGGQNWTNHQPPAGSGWGAGNAVFFMDNSSTWLVGSQSAGIWRTTNSGGSWTRVETRPIEHGATFFMTKYGNNYYVAVSRGSGSHSGVITSSNGGSTWTDISSGLPVFNAPSNVASDGTYLYTTPSFPSLGGFGSGFSWYRRLISGGNWSAMTNLPNVCNNTGGGTVCNGPVGSAYDAVNKIAYTVNWNGGVWKLRAAGSGGGGDTTAPAATITAPTSGQTVSGTINVTANASDNVGVSSVSFYLDGSSTAFATDATSPYSASWDSRTVSNGNHSIIARATDTSNNVGPSTSISFSVNNASSGRFTTLPVNATLPSESECASRVRPMPEVRPKNTTYNNDNPPGGNYQNSRITGNYHGTTDEIIQWAACKWGLDEDVLRAQAVQESYWTQTAAGDFSSDANACSPVYPIGSLPGHAGQCPESYGLLQVRWTYHKSAFYSSTTENSSTLTNNAIYSTAYNIDYYGSIFRSCYNGNETWLNTVERGAEYAAGDMWGCLGVWFSGRWRTAPALQYISNVQSNLNNRTWETGGFLGYQDSSTVLSRPGTDTTNPTTTLTSPTNGATVSGTVNVTATASDNVGVSRVELLIDGIVRVTDTTSPYSFSWDTRTYTNGSHTVRTRAFDTAGNSNQSTQITVNVSNTTPTPKPGDVNNDNQVNIFDLSILLSHWNATGQTRGDGDLDANGTVNIFDLSILLSNWGM